MSARKEPVPVAPTKFPEHPFVPNPYGPRDPIRQRPLECLFKTADGRACKWPKANGVHKSSEELVADLPPTPDEDRSDEIIGEGRES